jgi:hypothetical protein
MSFDQIVGNDMVILGGPERVADTILGLASRLDLMGLAMIFKLGAMPYDMERAESAGPPLRQRGSSSAQPSYGQKLVTA